MADRVLIVMTSGPDTPRRCATPFHMASLAAAMEYQVSIFFTVDGILLLKKGVAETVFAKAGGKPVSEFMHEAQEAGVQFIGCAASLDLHDVSPGELIDGVILAGGATMWDLSEQSKTVLSF